MVVLINLIMLAIPVALVVGAAALYKASTDSDRLYIRAVDELTQKARDATVAGDLAGRDRYNYALTALVRERDPHAPAFQTDHDDPFTAYIESRNNDLPKLPPMPEAAE